MSITWNVVEDDEEIIQSVSLGDFRQPASVEQIRQLRIVEAPEAVKELRQVNWWMELVAFASGFLVGAVIVSGLAFFK